jgi:hypothetical protein
MLSDIPGICEEEDGTWRMYIIGERGSIQFFPEKYTEDSACRALLSTLRYGKESSKKHRLRKVGDILEHPEKWFNT